MVIPAGNYKIGTLVMRSHVELHLETGATLYGSTDLKDYRAMKSDYVSLRTQTTTIQLIYADAVEDVSITGFGTIDGRGAAFKKLSWNDEGITRPHLLRFIQSKDIVVSDVTLKNSGCWMQHYLACDRVQIRGIKVFNRNNYNNDALDIDGCHDVVVSGMIADSDDDAITLKSTSPRLCENVSIHDCIVSSHCNAIKLGTETNGGFRNINIANCIVKPSKDQSSQFFGDPSKRGTSTLSLDQKEPFHYVGTFLFHHATDHLCFRMKNLRGYQSVAFFCVWCSIDYTPYLAPRQCSGTHGARLHGDINGTVVEIFAA